MVINPNIVRPFLPLKWFRHSCVFYPSIFEYTLFIETKLNRRHLVDLKGTILHQVSGSTVRRESASESFCQVSECRTFEASKLFRC